ncbi:hypothetical protein ACFSSF_09225 [Dietzia aerolata]|uniref:hypothetical protein n=1 Tax=Dietzia aerolata TaxID=595984 RepID=UPI0036322873
MTSASRATGDGRHVNKMRRSLGTLCGLLAPFVVALLVWVVAAPRSELVSVGGGRGVRFPDSGADGGSQLLMLVILLGFASICGALVLWSRHVELRRPAGVPVLALLPGFACALAAVGAPGSPTCWRRRRGTSRSVRWSRRRLQRVRCFSTGCSTAPRGRRGSGSRPEADGCCGAQ